jgi:hypothetical protein
MSAMRTLMSCRGRTRPRVPLLTPVYILAIAFSWRDEVRGG